MQDRQYANVKNISTTYCNGIAREWIKWTMKRHLIGYGRPSLAKYCCFFKNLAEQGTFQFRTCLHFLWEVDGYCGRTVGDSLFSWPSKHLFDWWTVSLAAPQNFWKVKTRYFLPFNVDTWKKLENFKVKEKWKAVPKYVLTALHI